MNIKLRKATTSDGEKLFEWRNDPLAYRHYHNPKPVDWQTHLDWFTASLMSSTREIFIVEESDVPVGMVRFDQTDGNRTELSWVVDSKQQRRGIGTALLKEARRMRDGELLAEIKKDNIGSIKIAEAAGFLLTKEENGTLFYVSTAK